jgi:predicted methyltransferase
MAVGAAAASSKTSDVYSAGYTSGAVNAGANAAAANANAAAANANAAAANANIAAANADRPYEMGAVYGALPEGCVTPSVSGGGTYYLCGNTWFSPSYGANGVYYRVVHTP